jgi:hypothetical protein
MRRMRLVSTLLLLTALSPWAARAEPSDVSASGFLSSHRQEVSAPPGAVYAALARVGEWWNGQHTYSGNAANLAIELRAGACFCERWGEGNTIEHGRVILAQRDRMLRIEGALGPLQEMAASGILQFAVAPAENDGSTLTVTYRVRAADAGLEKLAPVVDRVIGEQARRLAAYAARR